MQESQGGWSSLERAPPQGLDFSWVNGKLCLGCIARALMLSAACTLLPSNGGNHQIPEKSGLQGTLKLIFFHTPAMVTLA